MTDLTRDGATPDRVRRSRRMTALAEGPFTTLNGRPLTVTLSVPTERLRPGPMGGRFALEARAPGSSRTLPIVLTTSDDPWRYEETPAPSDVEALIMDTRFLAQHVYAVASSTLALFERTLGRRLPWRMKGHRLRLRLYDQVPYEQTGYDWQKGVIRFGHRRDHRTRRHVPLALYHDLVAHEVTHAILDGYRPHFSDADGTVDQFALHEAMADMIAMLSVFSSPERVQQQLQASGHAEEPQPDVETHLVQSGLFGVADELFSRSALRRSVTAEPGANWRLEREPHRRGEAIVRAVMDTVRRVWWTRMRLPGGQATTYQIAASGATAGAQVCAMVVRGLGYTPPVDVTFEDLLRGIIAADLTVAPDDDLGYRAATREAFATMDLRVGPDETLSGLHGLEGLHYPVRLAALGSDPEEMYRFLWENPALIRAAALDETTPVIVERVRPSTRVAPDGFVVSEISASFYQQVLMSSREARRRLGIRSAGNVLLTGGGLLRFDETGRLNFVALKPVLDADRQQRKVTDGAAVLPRDPAVGRSAVFQAMHRSGP